MKRKIKTAVIGVGNMGKNHARIYSEISTLVAVSDVIPSIGKPVAQRYKVKYYENYLEMLDKEIPEAVSIVVPTRYHKIVAIDCLKRKIPSLVEKPISDKLSDAEEIVKEAEKSKTFLMVGHIERFNPVVIKLKELISQGRFGRIISLLALRVGVNPPKTINSDVTLDLAIHDLDVFNFLLNEYPFEKKIIKNKIFRQNIADSASLLFRYKNTVGMIQTNWITPIKMRKLYITGTDGFAELDYIRQKLIIFNKVVVKKPVGDYFELVSLSKSSIKEVYVSKKEPLKEELKYFLSHLESKELLISSEAALEAVKIITL